MRMKRKDTQLLVENWRRLINEGEEKGDFTKEEIDMVQEKVDALTKDGRLSKTKFLVKVLNNKTTGSKHLCLGYDQGNEAPIQLFRLDKNNKGGMDRYVEPDSAILNHDRYAGEKNKEDAKALIKLKNNLKDEIL